MNSTDANELRRITRQQARWLLFWLGISGISVSVGIWMLVNVNKAIQHIEESSPSASQQVGGQGYIQIAIILSVALFTFLVIHLVRKFHNK
jgi:hypothetical protein